MIFESKPGLLLYEQCRRLNPRARYVYRVSDALRGLRSSHPVVVQADCSLPIVVPEPLRSSRPNIFCYVPNDVVSIQEALRAARAFDRSKVVTDDILSWDKIAQALAGQELS